MYYLSNESRAFLSRLRRLPESERKDDMWKVSYAQLFCELYELIDNAAQSLNKLALGKWSVSYEGEDSRSLAYSFRLAIQGTQPYPSILIKIHPFSQSSIEVLGQYHDIALGKAGNQIKISFFNSPAYKRYFAPFTQASFDLKTKIPKNQVLSRDFGNYITHLLKMMQPYLKEMSDVKKQLRAA